MVKWPPTFGDEKVTDWITWYMIITMIVIVLYTRCFLKLYPTFLRNPRYVTFRPLPPFWKFHGGFRWDWTEDCLKESVEATLKRGESLEVLAKKADDLCLGKWRVFLKDGKWKIKEKVKKLWCECVMGVMVFFWFSHTIFGIFTYIDPMKNLPFIR